MQPVFRTLLDLMDFADICSSSGELTTVIFCVIVEHKYVDTDSLLI